MRIKPTHFALAASVLFNLFGIPGHIEDAKMWKWWVSMAPSPDYSWVFHLLVSLGGLSLLYAVFPLFTQVYSRVLRRMSKSHHSVAAGPVSHHWHVSQPTVTVTRSSIWTRLTRRIKRGIGADSTRPIPVSGIAEIERCHQELVNYIRSQPPDPINFKHVALTQEFLPHIERARQILDEQNIAHPDIDADLVFNGMSEWGAFLARLLAVKHNVQKARLVYGQMRGETDSGEELHE